MFNRKVFVGVGTLCRRRNLLPLGKTCYAQIPTVHDILVSATPTMKRERPSVEHVFFSRVTMTHY